MKRREAAASRVLMLQSGRDDPHNLGAFCTHPPVKGNLTNLYDILQAQRPDAFVPGVQTSKEVTECRHMETQA